MLDWFVLAVLFCMVAGGVWCRSSEKKMWNNGVCAATGLPWVQFDTTSQGCRMYKSYDGNTGKTHYFTASYAIDKIRS